MYNKAVEDEGPSAAELLGGLLTRGRNLLRELERFEGHVKATISPKDKRYYELNSKALHRRVTQEVRRLDQVGRCDDSLHST